MKSKLVLFPIAFVLITLIALLGLMPSNPAANAAPLYAPTPVTVQTIYLTGTTPSYASAATDGNSIANDGKVYVELKSTAGSIVTVTVITPLTVNGLAVDDLNIQLPATTGNKISGPFLPSTFSPTGTMFITFPTTTTGVSLAAFTVQ